MFHVFGIDYEWSACLYYKYWEIRMRFSVREAAVLWIYLKKRLCATTVQSKNKLLFSLFSTFIHAKTDSLHLRDFGCYESGQSGFSSNGKNFNWSILTYYKLHHISIGVYFNVKFLVWSEFLQWMDFGFVFGVCVC